MSAPKQIANASACGTCTSANSKYSSLVIFILSLHVITQKVEQRRNDELKRYKYHPLYENLCDYFHSFATKSADNRPAIIALDIAIVTIKGNIPEMFISSVIVQVLVAEPVPEKLPVIKS